MAHSAPVIDCRQVTRTYNEGLGKLTIFSDISLEVAQGETVAIVGSSGAGKTTLLNLLGGLDKPSSGQIAICGEDIHRLSEARRARFRNAHLGFVYQFHHLLPEFTALENVMMPCALGGMAVSKSRDKASSLLERVGLAERLDHKPGELSGGERQRVAIARALVNEPDCVLMDEPTGNLDEHTGEGVQALIESLRDQLGIAFVMVTHDMKMARSLGRVMRLEQGRLIQEV
ncbi:MULTISPECIES: ABC transporter ATP-binding protein [Marinobacter]|jgi:lipoprotein-releasing system ATP-binding protein|uniref:ATP-binding cassette domain-containing protein n=1 Tax=Marinobacter adhaerens TaxID=1033846 RepID=A0A844HUB6_9GAMM|nr:MULTISPECIES: ATP-binding cassette domain-containing protein [Marinobacter]MTI98519.1 ATP-binding cassette domain-containing protein [Marinobacter adhaerens]MBO6811332.1 ATP-binding cassette domain-containing protein [Marinobacter sp.]MBO6874715.1 ATP-binding cassette domain-containing protein [Marinobacter sp.]MBY6070403.1 ATP-binding cassette domain-containing protein [Marinobacter salsuginis]QTN43725.1 ATP-binding cassette domain-containing protein [Marinobacter salsuginis]